MAKIKTKERKRPITTFLTEEEFSALADRQKETGHTKSSLIREAVIEWLRGPMDYEKIKKTAQALGMLPFEEEVKKVG